MRARVLLLPLLLAGCGDAKPAESKPASTDAVIAAWQQAGLTPTSELIATDGAALGGGSCRAGVVAGLEVTLCEYADAAAAAKAQPAGTARVGETTGTAVLSGSMMLVIADRKKADPSGKTIDRLIKTFQRGPSSTK